MYTSSDNLRRSFAWSSLGSCQNILPFESQRNGFFLSKDRSQQSKISLAQQNATDPQKK